MRPLAAMGACALLLSLAPGCGGDDVVVLHLRRAPTIDPACGMPPDAAAARVRALGDFPVGEGSEVTFALDGGRITARTFSPRIEAVAVEVLDGAGERLAVGRSAAFDFDDARDGDEVVVFMAPVDGACEVAPMQAPRAMPLVARLGGGVLIAGGRAGGVANRELELYDPDLGTSEVLAGDHYGTGPTGFIGASLTSMGKVAVAVGGPVTAWQAWSADGTSAGPQFLPEARAFHAAVALDEHRIFLAGGCAQVGDDLGCAPGSALRTTSILDIDSGRVEAGPRLSGDRIGGAGFVDVDGTVLLVGGVDAGGDPVPSAERLDLNAGTSEVIDGAGGGAAAQLDSGSVVVGFGANAPSGILDLVPAGKNQITPLIGGGARDGATMTALEDGSALVVGGGGGVARVRPFDGALLPVATDLGGVRRQHATVVLGDGSVLVLGGLDEDGAPRRDVWRFRPSLAGPLDNVDHVARFTDLASASEWVPRDPAHIERVTGPTPHAELTSSGSGDLPSEYVLVGGPRFGAVSATATVAAPEGIALLVGYERGRGWLITLQPGQEARLSELRNGSLEELVGCDVEEVVAGADVAADGPVSVTADVSSDELIVRSGTRRLLRCGAAGEPPHGQVGIGALGPAGSVVRIDALSLSRRLP